MAEPSTPAAKPARPPVWILVRATRPGTSVERGSHRHFLRERGDIFEVNEGAFAGEWMEKIGQSPPPEFPPDPPPTTLPSNLAPQIITG